ncbi:MAG: hypothetical protein SD837_20620 [Candidatus Electrothrix scaldis]|nr:MAG: hypothetical protein SD837_20620 [Candidatus Electrothrix sp. GW3-3]
MLARVIACQEMKYTVEHGKPAQPLAGCAREVYSDEHIDILKKPENHVSGTGTEPSESQTCLEIRTSLASFDMVPRHKKGLLHMVRDDLSRMENVAEQQHMLAQCNVYCARRSETQIKIEFLDMNKPEGSRICFRMVYEFASPLA